MRYEVKRVVTQSSGGDEQGALAYGAPDPTGRRSFDILTSRFITIELRAKNALPLVLRRRQAVNESEKQTRLVVALLLLTDTRCRLTATDASARVLIVLHIVTQLGQFFTPR